MKLHRRVSLVQTETNFRFSAVTNAEGIYRVQSLQPGTYRITVSMSTMALLSNRT